MLFRLICVTLAMSLFATLASAKTTKTVLTTYDCKTASTKTNTLFSAEYLVLRDQNTGTVQVLDGVIQSMFGKPIDAKIKRENDAVMVVGWTLKNVVNSERQSATLNFTLAIQKANGNFTIQMLPLGYGNTFENQGLCAVSLQ